MSRTYEELKAGFERIEAAQACRNLMGKYSYLHTAMRNIDFMNLWQTERMTSWRCHGDIILELKV